MAYKKNKDICYKTKYSFKYFHWTIFIIQIRQYLGRKNAGKEKL